MDQAKPDDAKRRAEIISNRIRSRADELVRRKITAFQGNLSWNPGQLGIDREAWGHVQAIKANPALVSAHPDVLCAHPDASLHYRGIATLSLKRVQQIAGSVTRWEESPNTARVTQQCALDIARLYNLIVGVVSEAMRKQLGQMQIEKFFLLNETLHNDAEWVKFINEVFHHTLRLLDTPCRTP